MNNDNYSDTEVIEVDPLWLYYVFVRRFGHSKRFPRLTKLGIACRKRDRSLQPLKYRKKKGHKSTKLPNLRKVHRGAERSALIRAIFKEKLYEKYNTLNSRAKHLILGKGEYADSRKKKTKKIS